MNDYEKKEIIYKGLLIIQPAIDLFNKEQDVSQKNLNSRFAVYVSELSRRVLQYDYCELINKLYKYNNLSYTLCQEFIKDFASISFENPNKNFAEYVEYLDSIEFTISNFVYEFIVFFCDTQRPTYSEFKSCLNEYRLSNWCEKGQNILYILSLYNNQI